MNHDVAAVFPRTPLHVDPTNENVVYAMDFAPTTWESRLLKSIDGGAHWRVLPIPFFGILWFGSLVIDPGNPATLYISYHGPAGPGGGIVKSVDGGQAWSTVNNGLAPGSVYTLTLNPGRPAQLFAGNEAGIFRSVDGAQSWVPLKSGLPKAEVFSLAIDRTGTLLRAATGAGLFEYRLDAMTPQIVNVVEYYQSATDHYFITADAAEITSLDQGTIAGWSRTGLAFNAYAAPYESSVPVCRFTNPASAQQSTHFYTPWVDECALLRAIPDWTLEKAAAFEVNLPTVNGACANGEVPVYRLFNNGQGGSPNHRFTTDRNAVSQMLDRGWLLEGIGADTVNMCATQ